MIKESSFSLRFLTTTLILAPFLLFAQGQAVKVEVQEEKNPEEISLQTAEFYNLKKEREEEKKTILASYKSKLEAILLKYVEEYDAMYENYEKTGNTKGMGIARAARNVFLAAQEELVTKGNFTLPEKVRKEISDSVDKCRKEQESVMAEVGQRQKEIDDKYKERFAEIYKPLCGENANISDEILAKKFKEFLEIEIKKPEIDKKQAAQLALLEELGIKNPSEIIKPPSNIIASKGTGSTWIDIGIWTGEMVGMDVVTIPLLNRSKDSTEMQFFAPANASSKLIYKAIRPMPPHPNYAFRLKRVPNAEDVDVIEWPSARNDWKLIVCTRPPETIPLKHAFIIQVSLPEGEIGKIFSGDIKNLEDESDVSGDSAPKETEVKKKTGPPVKVSFTSIPQGAEIYLDNKIYSLNGKTVLTPCEITIPSGKYNIKISKFGYLDQFFDNFDITHRAVINVKLVKHPDAKYIKKVLEANVNTWVASGASLKPGDKVLIQVDGMWACAKKSDRCGPTGIPNTTEHYEYYADSTKDLRKEKNFLYGALLMKIGEKGQISSPGQTVEFMAKEEAEIFFDINELEGKARKGNSGSLTVNITIIPAGK